ncbi:MAG: hypothetical protein AB7O37_05550 [Vicinamibacteria bacterium]
MDDGRPELSRATVSAGLGRGGALRRLLPALAAVGAAAVALLAPGLRAARGDRFTSTFESPARLAEAVLLALQERDGESLRSLPLSEREFREEVWPEMPAAGRVPAGLAWQDLRQKGENNLRRALAELGGRRLAVERLTIDGGTTAYGTFVVHRKPRLRVRDLDSGERAELALFGSILEHERRYKLFSWVVSR